jgi:hypothetical protein
MIVALLLLGVLGGPQPAGADEVPVCPSGTSAQSTIGIVERDRTKRAASIEAAALIVDGSQRAVGMMYLDNFSNRWIQMFRTTDVSVVRLFGLDSAPENRSRAQFPVGSSRLPAGFELRPCSFTRSH